MPKDGYSHIIWDWNGTLLDDVNWCISVVNSMLARRGLAPLKSIADYREAFCFPVVEYYRNVGFNLESEPFPALAEEYMALYLSENTGGCKLHPGAENVLAAVKEKSIRQVILSASEQRKLKGQVESLGAAHYFGELLGISDIYAKGKLQLGLDYIVSEKPRRALFIGDTAHDHEVATAIGADCLLIARGHQSEHRLRALGVPVLKNIAEVPSYL